MTKYEEIDRVTKALVCGFFCNFLGYPFIRTKVTTQ